MILVYEKLNLLDHKFNQNGIKHDLIYSQFFDTPYFSIEVLLRQHERMALGQATALLLLLFIIKKPNSRQQKARNIVRAFPQRE